MQVAVGDDGRIEASGDWAAPPDQRLTGSALLPGFVNAHSHAFQRGLRGPRRDLPRGRRQLLDLARGDVRAGRVARRATLRALCLRAFREMRAAGITTVGEFHYVHHDARRRRLRLRRRRCWRPRPRRASASSCCSTYYRTGALGPAARGRPAPLRHPSLDGYWRQMDRLAGRLDPAHADASASSAHSLRAASPERHRGDLRGGPRGGTCPSTSTSRSSGGRSRSRVAAYGRRADGLLLEARHGEDLTAVHCTHTDAEEMDRFLAAGGTVCLCPLTEGNLGDGIPTLDRAHAAGRRLCIGSDSNARLPSRGDALARVRPAAAR